MKILALLLCLPAIATAADTSRQQEETLVIGTSVSTDQGPQAHLAGADSASALKQIPGADIAANGPLTGQAQYRGMYGSRVNIAIDGGHIVTGGPNSMDTPLSNAPASLVHAIKVTRGIASVSAGQETLGGHISVKTQHGEFSEGDNFQLHGDLNLNATSNNSGQNTGLIIYTSNENHKFTATGAIDSADDAKLGGGDTITATEYKRDRASLAYGYQDNKGQHSIQLTRNNTGLSGTPALPMDIRYIDSDIAALSFHRLLGATKVKSHLTYSAVEHGMDNYTLRTTMPAMQRFTAADGEQLSYTLGLSIPFENNSTLNIGLDNSATEHSADVTNPNNAMFLVRNFNNTTKDTLGLYAEWVNENKDWQYEVGLRYNQIDTDADSTTSAGMMGMMATHATTLETAFNSADRSTTHNNLDWVIKGSLNISDKTSLNSAIGRKSRAPAYQELYLWLPMQATGGLADGRSYIGNLELDSEVGHEINLGLHSETKTLSFSPQIFYREVHDYIQGTATTNMAANMLSTMMSGNAALQFNNIDAKFYGLDAGFGWQMNTAWQLNGQFSYVQGTRTDAKDDLYRIAPLNTSFQFSYTGENYGASTELRLYAKQDKVSSFNNEAATPGYGIVNLLGHYQVSPGLLLKAGINNVADKKYQDHLAGYNRVSNSDIALGERLFGMGRSAYIQVNYRL